MTADPHEAPTSTTDSALFALDQPDIAQMARLIFLSYRYSQGGIGTQNRMLLYIEDQYFPEMFTPQISPKVQKGAKTLVGSFFLNEAAHPATAVPWEEPFPGTFAKTPVLVENEVNGLFERFAERNGMESFGFSPADIAASLITMDYDYLTRLGGRAGTDPVLKVKVADYHRDPYDSLFLKHGALKVSTRTKEFDEIFAVASSDSTVQELDELTSLLLLWVLDIYMGHHPETRDLEQLTRLKTACETKLNGK